MKTITIQHNAIEGWKSLSENTHLDSENTLILAFCSPVYKNKPEVFKELREHFPKAVIAGCSTSGEINNAEINDNSLSGAIIQFESSEVRYAIKELSQFPDSFQLGQNLASEISAESLKGIIVLSDGLGTDGSALVDGIKSSLSSEVIISGGLAGDGTSFKDTWTLCGDEIRRGFVLGIGLYGNELELRNSSRAGWNIFGPERVITKSLGSTVYEIDGKPALDLYKKYLGEKAKDLPSSGLLFPLQIRENKTDDNRLVRTLLAVDEKAKSLTFAGTVPKGCLAQLMRANFERLIDAASEAGESCQYLKIADSGDSLVMAVSCVGRRLVLGERAYEELEALKSVLNQKTNIIGFYSYGEIGVSIEGKACDLHNQSMTVLSLSEKKVA